MISRPLIMTTGCLQLTSKFCIVVTILAAAIPIGVVCAQNSFQIASNNYSCSSNLICLGEAHVYAGDQSNAIQDGRLSLLNETLIYNTSLTTNVGVAYYNQPVKFLDYSSRQPVSFNTSFTTDIRLGINGSGMTGDGMTFVISADNSSTGYWGDSFGIFSSEGITNFKCIVVEYDTHQNVGPPNNDISDNHVSLDLNSSITWTVARNASDVNVTLSDEYTLYSWVEYSSETQQLEVRISYWPSRPLRPLLNYKINLFDNLEEYMWVGFSSGSKLRFSNYYIGDWKFESWFGSIQPTASGPESSGTPGGGLLRESNRSHRGLILGISIAVPAALLVCLCVVITLVVRSSGSGVYKHFQLRKNREENRDLESQNRNIEENDMMPIEGMPERFTYKQLSEATGDFNKDSILGQGGFGSVYRGVLPLSRRPVAVKKIRSDSGQGEKEFMAEVHIISQLRHRHLIQLLGWCKEMAGLEKYLLVYELMPNGSLDKWLFPKLENVAELDEKTSFLSWQQRFNIVNGTAAALDYLHRGCNKRVIHRDVKASNIMLDEEWNAKLGDFGLARLVDHQRAATTITVAGTRGYMAPEAASSGHFTDKTDVFAFGAVMLEVACGRKAFLAHLPAKEMFLVDWVWGLHGEGDLHSAVDKRLEDFDTRWMEVVLILGLSCSHPDPSSRPSMRQVVQVLAGDAPVPSIPLSKPRLFSSQIHRSISNGDDRDQEFRGISTSGSISLVSTNFSDSSRAKTGKFRGGSLKYTSSLSEEVSDNG